MIGDILRIDQENESQYNNRNQAGRGGREMNIKEEIDEKYYLTYLRLLAAFGDKDVIIEMRRALRGKRLSFYQYFRLQVARTQLGRKIIRILYKFYFHKYQRL